MELWIILLILIIAVIIMIIAGIYVTKAADELGNFPFNNQDGMLQSAYGYLVAGAVVTWVAVGLIVVAGIGMLLFSEFIVPAVEGAAVLGGAGSLINVLIVIAVLVAGGLALLDGLLGAFAAYKIIHSTYAGDPRLQQPYVDSIITAVAGIGGAFFIAGAFILLILKEKACPQKKKK